MKYIFHQLRPIEDVIEEAKETSGHNKVEHMSKEELRDLLEEAGEAVLELLGRVEGPMDREELDKFMRFVDLARDMRMYKTLKSTPA